MVLLPKIPALKTPSVDAARKKELQIFEKHAGIRFRKLEFLNLAFSHRSFSNETASDIDNNEKLEFLGDSVLGLVVSDYLFRIMSERPEGELARIKSFVVSEDSLAAIAKNIKVDNYILIGKGEEYSGGREKKAILADCMEAIFGAYYLDSGFKNAQSFILKYLVPEIEKVLANKHRKDYKTLLQEYVQKKYKSYPKYNLVKKTGPDHDRTFWIEVAIKDMTFGPGTGKNKKEAEQKVAGIAYETLTKDESDKN
ncbi:MAG: ribonuclease III [Spirochaetales bacterium]|nr:ribonuclease III [Spirochaetales bacterium]